MKNYKVKDGVSITYLKKPLVNELNNLAVICKAINGNSYIMTITSGNDGIHMKNSKHYSNEAIDIRIRDMGYFNKFDTRKAIKNFLGKDYDVILERDHIHIEYDPK